MQEWCPVGQLGYLGSADIQDILPGLWVLALVAVLVWGLRRFYDRPPVVALAAIAMVVGVALGPALFTGQIALPLDSLRGRAPFRGLEATEPHGNPLQGDLLQLVVPAGVETRRALRENRWPLWNAQAGPGLPTLADPQAQVLQPLTLAALPFDPARGAGVTAALRLVLALLFAVLWLRRIGLSEAAALFGGLSWGLGGFLFLWLGWPLANSAAWLPAVLYAGYRVADRGGRRDVALLVLTLCGLLTAGHPETVLYALLLAAVLITGRLVTGRQLTGRRIHPDDNGAESQNGLPEPLPTRARVLRAIGALVLAAGITAPAWLPALIYAPQTLRASRLGETSPTPLAESYSERAALRLIPLVTPNAFGNDRYLHYWGGDNTNEDASGFPGTVALLLVLVSLATPWRTRRQEEKLLLAALAVCLVILAQLPGVVALLSHLPGGSTSAYHHRLLMVVAFALATLAACELDRRAAEQGSDPARDAASGPRPAELKRSGGATARALVPVLAAASALGGLIAWASLAFPHPRDPALLEVVRIGWLHWHGRFLAAGSLLLVAAAVATRWGFGASAPGGLRPRLARSMNTVLPLAFSGLVAAELLLLHLPAHPPAPPRLAFPTPPALSFLQRELRPGERFTGLDLALLPNLGSVYGLADARLYNPMAPAIYLVAAEPVIIGWEGEVPDFGNPEHPFYDRMGVRFVLAPAEAALPPPMREVFSDMTPGGGGGSGEPPTGATIWERPRFRQRIFGEGGSAVIEVDSLESSRILARWQVAAASDQLGTTGAGIGPAAGAAGAAGPPAGKLATSIYQDGGWKLLVDGRRHAAGRDAAGFVAASVPTPPAAESAVLGEQRLTLLYRPASFLAGSLLAALALALGLTWLLPAPPAVRPARGEPADGTRRRESRSDAG